MADRLPVLILGGTEGARRLAEVLEAHPRLRPVTALAGRTADPARLAGKVRVGGFGGVDGLAAYARSNGIAALADATHPFAARISRHAAAAATATGIPLLRLERRPWERLPGDLWTDAEDIPAAVTALPAEPSTVFLTIGRQDLAPFAEMPQHRYILRMIDLPSDPLPVEPAQLILARGPFREREEAALMETLAVDVLVSKNAGGAATYGKIAAARRLGIPVVMVARPALPPAPAVETVGEAVAWLDRMSTRPTAGM